MELTFKVFPIKYFQLIHSCFSWNILRSVERIASLTFLWVLEKLHLKIIIWFLYYSPLWEMIQDGIDLKSIEWTQH